MSFSMEQLFISFDIMWKGMLGLFLVSILIIIPVMVIKFLFIKKDKPSS